MASNEREMEAIRDRIADLEKRVAALEVEAGKQPSNSQQPSASPGKESPAASPGMGSPDVLSQLLGSPFPEGLLDAGDWAIANMSTEADWQMALLSPPEVPVTVTVSPEPYEVGGNPVTVSERTPTPDSISAPGRAREPSKVGGLQMVQEYTRGCGMTASGALPTDSTDGADSLLGARSEAVLVVGDSMVRRARFSAPPPYYLTVRARGGLSWTRDLSWARRQVLAWAAASRAEGRHLGPVLVWVGGNDVYPGPDGRRGEPVVARLGALLEDLTKEVPEVILVGPTPRPKHDEGLPWNRTPAFLLERDLLTLRNRNGVQVICVGRRVCRWRNGKNRGYHVHASVYFDQDLVHLSGPGYERMSERLPSWLAMGAARLR